MGYLGGVNINILVALVVQMLPLASPSSLFRKFFAIYKYWYVGEKEDGTVFLKAKVDPVMLTKPYDAGLGYKVWDAKTAAPTEMMPIITPAYPAMNSTFSISRQTQQIMLEEIVKADKILTGLEPRLHLGDGENNGGGRLFAQLFTPSDFFISYPHYLALTIVSPTPAELDSWGDFLKSRLRRLVSDNLGSSLPLSKIQLYVKEVQGCFADATQSQLTQSQKNNSVAMFIGFNVDRNRMKGEQLNLESTIQNFKNRDLAGKYEHKIPGNDLLVKYFPLKKLPKACFTSYEGGKEEGMRKRVEIRGEDPKRLKRKREVELKERKEKLGRMKRKLEEEAKEKEKDKDKDKAREASGDATDDVNVKIEDKDDDDDDKTENENLNENFDEDEDEDEDMYFDDDENDNDNDEYYNNGGVVGDEKPAKDALALAQALAVINGDRGQSFLEKYGNSVEQLAKAGYLGLESVTDKDGEIYTIVGIVPEWRREEGERKKTSENENKKKSKKKRLKLEFKAETFAGVVKYDANGRPVDRGDENYKPQMKFTGGMEGWEFKLGKRGLGYYKTIMFHE